MANAVRSLTLFTLALLALNATAAVYLVPEDDDLITASHAIVVGTVKEMFSEFAGGRIVTNIDIEPEEILKGDLDPSETIRLVEPGGVVGSRIMMVSASPTYWKENRALIFLTKTEEGQWQTYGAGLGKFDFVEDGKGRKLAVRWATTEPPKTWSADGQPHFEKLRDAVKFMAHIRRGPQLQLPAVAAPADEKHPSSTEKQTAAADYVLEEEAAAESLSAPHAWDPVATGAFPPSAYTHNGNWRWDDFDANRSVLFRASGSQPGQNSIGTAQTALAAWTNDPGSNVQYLYEGTSSAGFVEDGQNTIVFNSPTGVPAGNIAYAQWFADDTHLYKGETFYSISEGDVVVRQNLNVSATVFLEAVTHELGHTLGFRHSDAGVPSSSAAIMESSLSGAYGATLQPWDIEAVRTVYESTVTTPLPAAPANLVARATSTTSVTITWSSVSGATGYRLERSSGGGAFTQIATPTGTSFTNTGLTPGTTYVYRVRAVNSAGPGAYSNRDHATTIIFTDDPLVPGVTVIKAVHLTQLRQAVNAVRAAAGLAPATFTDSSLTGVPVKAIHITQLRSALTPALTALGKPAPTYISLTAGSVIRAVHFQELRNLVK